MSSIITSRGVRVVAVSVTSLIPASLVYAIQTDALAAAKLTPTTVTIKAEQVDLSGTVRSPKKVCKNNRKVFLVKQKGAKFGGDDKVIATDTTELKKGVGVWRTGNTGIEGKFYAKVKKTSKCRAAVSKTVVAERDD
ncbi:hypothetical protein [Nocardioides sp. KR10-350]|uniref:hypothetical protein n=1 Tax=Nocardioides cheoyonin TaxID=3156615 RepID=UPI0032B5C905